MRGRKGLLGFPLYEIALIIVLAGLIVWVISGRVAEMLERAERSAVDTTITNLRSGLRLEKARRISVGQSNASLLGSNPVALVATPLIGYCENISPEGSRNPSDCPWVYMDAEHVLYYRPERHAHLQAEAGAYGVVLAWAIVQNPLASKDVELLPVKLYQWF